MKKKKKKKTRNSYCGAFCVAWASQDGIDHWFGRLDFDRDELSFVVRSNGQSLMYWCSIWVYVARSETRTAEIEVVES